MPVTRAFSDEAETYRAPGAIGRGAVEDQPLEAAAPTVPIPAAHGSADGTVVDRGVSRHGNEDPGGRPARALDRATTSAPLRLHDRCAPRAGATSSPRCRVLRVFDP